MADPVQSPGSEAPGPSPTNVQEEQKLNVTQKNEGPQENSARINQSPNTKTEDRDETSSETGPEEESEMLVLDSDSVLCDSCMDSPSPALKSCLTCLVSFCELHLRPHLENPKFSQHRLVDPLRDIERRTCEVHHRGLDWFCVPDQVCVCEGCADEEHRGHELHSVEQARRHIERELKQKQAEMVKTVAAAENAINKLQNNTVSIESSVAEARSVVDAQFELLSGSVERTKRALVEVLEAEEKQAIKQADGIRVHLENRLSDLRKTQVQVQKISRNKNHLDFLQEYSEWKAGGTDTSLPGVYIGLMDSLNSFSKIVIDSTEKLCSMMHSEFIQRLQQLCSEDTSSLGIKTTVRSMVAVKHNQSLPDPQTRADLLQYAKSFSFDANTAHKFLRLTEENRKVTNTTPWQHPYPEHPERFEERRQVLALESVYLDRAYYELEVSGEGAYLGLAYKSIERKGREPDSGICSTNAAWCLQWGSRSLSVWHSDVETPLSAPQTCFSRLGVYVDHAAGRLRFYGLWAGQSDGEDLLSLIHEFRAEFREPLYPAFWLSKKENAVMLVVPGEPLKSTLPSPPTSPPNRASPPASPPTSPTNTPKNNTSAATNNANNNNNNDKNNGSQTGVTATSASTITSTVTSASTTSTATSTCTTTSMSTVTSTAIATTVGKSTTHGKVNEDKAKNGSKTTVGGRKE